jgi:hypothetical protein
VLLMQWVQFVPQWAAVEYVSTQDDPPHSD